MEGVCKVLTHQKVCEKTFGSTKKLQTEVEQQKLWVKKERAVKFIVTKKLREVRKFGEY